MFSFRSINSTNNPPQPQQRQTPPSFKNVNFSLFAKRSPTQLTTPLLQETPPVYPKLKWGEPIWNLFHVMAEKVIPEHFFRMRTEIFEIVRSICYNLPCPECANHARTFINGVQFNAITAPIHLKNLFFEFHNMVNTRKHVPLYERELLEPKYSTMDLRNAIRIFLIHFRDKHKSSRMMADDLFRSKLANKIELWFSQNLQYFAL